MKTSKRGLGLARQGLQCGGGLLACQEATWGRSFCKCWVHNGFVNVVNEKSKGIYLYSGDATTSPSPRPLVKEVTIL